MDKSKHAGDRRSGNPPMSDRELRSELIRSLTILKACVSEVWAREDENRFMTPPPLQLSRLLEARRMLEREIILDKRPDFQKRLKQQLAWVNEDIKTAQRRTSQI